MASRVWQVQDINDSYTKTATVDFTVWQAAETSNRPTPAMKVPHIHSLTLASQTFMD